MPLPAKLDVDGKVCQWDFESEAWEALQEGFLQEATDAIHSDIAKNLDIIEHARKLGIADMAMQKSIQYK